MTNINDKFQENHAMTIVKLKRQVLTLLLAIGVGGCAATADPWVSQLPEVASENSATLTARSILNVSNVLHEHILRIDGVLAGKFENDQTKTFQIPAGKHNLTLTCHTNMVDTDVFRPINYNVANGKAKLDIDAQPGDELCVKISFSLLNCAVIEEADPSYCQRTQE